MRAVTEAARFLLLLFVGVLLLFLMIAFGTFKAFRY